METAAGNILLTAVFVLDKAIFLGKATIGFSFFKQV
jgi:hypothetical protein